MDDDGVTCDVRDRRDWRRYGSHGGQLSVGLGIMISLLVLNYRVKCTRLLVAYTQLYKSLCLSVCLPVSLPVCLSEDLSFCVCLCLCLSVSLYVLENEHMIWEARLTYQAVEDRRIWGWECGGHLGGRTLTVYETTRQWVGVSVQGERMSELALERELWKWNAK